jgi:hypothetical protein
MSLQTRTYGATNFTYFNSNNGANITSPLGLDTTGSNESGAIGSTLRPIRIRSLQITFSNSTGITRYKLSSGNDTSDLWSSTDVDTTTSTTISPTRTANYPAFTSSTLFYGHRKRDTGTTRVQRGDVASQMFANGSALNGPIRATVVWETAPNAPTGLSVSSLTSTSATITWTKPTDLGGLTVLTGYRILYKESTSSTWISTGKVGSDTTTSRTITGLDPSTEYNFLVAATNAVTDSINSSYTSASAHTGTNGTEITATTLTGIRVWNGSSFIVGATKVWSGSAFVTGRIRVWNGSAWVDAK